MLVAMVLVSAILFTNCDKTKNTNIEVTCKNSTGAAVANATVTLTTSVGTNTSVTSINSIGSQKTATTDATGVAKFTSVDPGTYYATAIKTPMASNSSAPITVDKHKTATVSLTLN